MSLRGRLAKLEGKGGKPERAAPLCVFEVDSEGGYWQTDAAGVRRRYTEAEAEALCGAGPHPMILLPCNGRDRDGC